VIATDGVVTLRSAQPGDAKLLVEGRDEEFFKWLGPGSDCPAPVACIWADDRLVGWVDYDLERDWLGPGQVNVGYFLFSRARGNGYASRAVELLLQHLDRDTEHTVATLLIHPENVRSLALARRLGFVQEGEIKGEPFFTRAVRLRPMATVAEVMNRNVLTVDPTSSIGEAAEKMMDAGVGAVVVMEDMVRLTGIVTERDILRAVAQRARAAEARVRQWMTESVITIEPETTVEDAAKMMFEKNFRHLPVCKDGRLLGIVSLRRLSQYEFEHGKAGTAST
jgi:CBS domain-containing protein/L-amino acid N-acyltransferase YncA